MKCGAYDFTTSILKTNVYIFTIYKLTVGLQVWELVTHPSREMNTMLGMLASKH